MIEFGTTTWVVQDTGVIELPSRFVSFNGNRDDGHVNSGFELINGVRGDISVTSSLGRRWSNRFFALSVFSSVSVIFFEISSVGFIPFKGVVHETTSTSGVTTVFGTVNKLLFRERLKISSSLEIESFHSSNSRESPTRTTLSLIFNIINSTVGDPVNGSGEIRRYGFSDVSFFSWFHW